MKGMSEIIPLMTLPEGSRVTRLLLQAGLLFIIVWGIRFTAYVFTIIAVSLILTLLALACILVLILLSLYSFEVLLRDLPLYQAQLNERIAGISATLARYGLSAGIIPSSPDLSSLTRTLLSSIMSLADLLLYLFFIAVTSF